MMFQCVEKSPTTPVSDQLVIIDFEYINQKIIFPVKINKKTYRFCLDTGSKTSISENLSRELVSATKSYFHISDGNNKHKSIPSATLDHIKIGSLTFKNVEVLTYSLEGAFACFGYEGYIGSDLLLDQIIQIDLKAKKIYLTKNINILKIDPSSGQEMVLVNDQKSPYTWMKIIDENRSIIDYVMIDTGMKGLYDLSIDTYQRTLEKKEIIKLVAKGKGSSTISAFGLEDVNEQWLYRYPTLSIGGIRIKNYVNKVSYALNSRVGSKLLDYGVVTLDFINKRFYFDPTVSEVELEPKKKYFSSTFLNEKFIVGIVWDDALKNKIQFGDQILEVNGKIINNMNF